VLEVGEVVPTGDSLLGTIAGSRTLGAAGDAAAGNVTAAGVESRRRAWMVPVTRLASSATFQRRSEAPGSRRRRRVTSHATPRSTVLCTRYVSIDANRRDARGAAGGQVVWSEGRGRWFRRLRALREDGGGPRGARPG